MVIIRVISDIKKIKEMKTAIDNVGIVDVFKI